MIADENFNWRLEEACMNAWPSELSILYDGWLARRSGGSIRRSNSINPLRGPRSAPDAVIGFAERFYAECGQDAIFRVPQIADDLDEALAGRGYATEARTLTLVADLAGDDDISADQDVLLTAAPPKAWLHARSRLAEADAVDRGIYTAMTRLIRLPARFACIEIDGEIVAQAYAVMHRGIVVLNSIATDPAFRQRGLGRRVVASLLNWGRRQGAEFGCLQVVEDNVPAVKLYRSVGFSHFAYSYHYRVRH